MKHRSFQFSLQIKNRNEKTMVKIKHFQYRTILETDFLSNEGENEVRFLWEERIFSPKLEKSGIHSVPTRRLLEIYFARNERKSHVNFCQNEGKSCLHIYEAGGRYHPPPGRAATNKMLSSLKGS